MILLAPPASLNGAALADELTAALGVEVDVRLIGDDLALSAPDDAPIDEARARQVVAAHTPPAPAADPDAELIAAITAATTLAQLKDALVGKGRSAVVAGRDKNR